MMLTILIGLGAVLLISALSRLLLSVKEMNKEEEKESGFFGRCVISQTMGDKEIQSDLAGFESSSAGTLAVLTDGMGKANTGKVCAQTAMDCVLDAYQPYQVLHNPEYFFKTAFYEANQRVQKTLGERRGGACLAAVFVNGFTFHYGLAGDIRIALFRNQELIPISKGQTLNVLALNAYQDGVLSRQEAIWTMEEDRIWNYLGVDGFRDIEICDQPIRLKQGDIIVMLTKGIFDVLSWAETEDVLLRDYTLKEKADNLVMEAERKKGMDKENGSVVLIKAEVSDEKN
ncbi:PP2C family serine/threonine-protein phosphatase [Lacrimispora sp.]|uniref:PP2C family protein-serine/threonine phosphatase n=1 Tax=Lacrimispora sp. TaxID=2719234 RepID=UPI0029DF2BE1|nr:family protein phosphatase [Lacrimispora sp.]